MESQSGSVFQNLPVPATSHLPLAIDALDSILSGDQVSQRGEAGASIGMFLFRVSQLGAWRQLEQPGALARDNDALFPGVW